MPTMDLITEYVIRGVLFSLELLTEFIDVVIEEIPLVIGERKFS